jgi:hypothetical protein
MRAWNRRLSKEEWEISVELLELLRVPYQIMNDFQSNSHPTLSRVAPAIVILRKTCQQMIETLQFPATKRVAASILTSSKSRFSEALNQPIYSLATFVDPLTKSWYNELPVTARDCVKNFILSNISKTTTSQAPPTSTGGWWDKIDISHKEFASDFDLNHYLVSPVATVGSFLTHQPPIIRNLYLEICGIPATSSDVERLFSTCGYVNSPRRSSMNSESVEHQSLLKKNASLVEKFRTTASLYPTSTPKLTNWLVTLPTMSTSFFGDDGDDDGSLASLDKEETDFTLEEATSASSFEEDDIIAEELLDPYWGSSSCEKNFSKQVAEINTRGRKRKRGTEDEEDSTNAKKRQRTTELIPLIYPVADQRVWIHYTADCTCSNKNKRECTCDKWFTGVVQYQEEDNREGNHVFIVSFDCGDEEEVTWDPKGTNDWWLTCKEVTTKK